MLMLLWLACTSTSPEGKPAGDDSGTLPRTELCTGGRDEDGDSLVDCADPDCTEACPEVCTGGVDDDADGLVDCDDPDCTCDADGDGFVDALLGGDDCDDSRPEVHPGAVEICGGLDDDCDGLVDDLDPDLVPDLPFYADLDGDGFGALPTQACVAPPGHVAIDGDCDDADPDIYPGAPEVCSGLDDDCDGRVDEDDPDLVLASRPTWFTDTDGDGLGDAAESVVACDPGPGWSLDATDCNDGDPDVGGPVPWRADADGDGYGGGEPSEAACTPPLDGWVAGEEDCDDTTPAVSPAAADIPCDGLDQDCDGLDAACPVAEVAQSILLGETPYGEAGGALAVGDVRGDGTLQLLVAARRDERAEGLAGSVVVVDALSPRVMLGAQPTRIDGAAGWEAGTAVATADWDGDGWLDVAVGAPMADRVEDQAGAVALVTGPLEGPQEAQTAPLWEGTRQRALAGSTLATADVEGPALLVGSPGDSDDGSFTGAAYLLLEPLSGGTLDDADTWFPGQDILQRMGSAVLAPGDLDGDGAPDFVIGARGDAAAGFDSGAVAVHRWPVLGDRRWADADARWHGDSELHAAGSALASGDVDGDGQTELWIGAPGASTVALVDGGRDGDHVLSDAMVRVVGLPGDRLGTALVCGDVDGDGIDDLWVGAPARDDGRGVAALYLGPVDGVVEGPAWSVVGATSIDALGSAVAVLGSDLVVGAPFGEATLGGAYLLRPEL